jgi:tetratricopeptide (TPR) repeat protein
MVRVELIGMSHGYATLELSPISGQAPPQPPKTASGHAVSAVDLGVPDNARREYEKGESSLEQHKLDASVGHFRKAVQMYETFPQAYERLGSAYLQQQKWTEAQTALQRAIRLDPKLAEASLELGAVFNQTREYSKAEAALTHGLELNPDSPMGHYELAKALWALGRWQDAAPHASTAVAALPDLAAAHVLLGNILLRQQDLDGALREYQTYLRLDPNGSMAAGTREMVEKIKHAAKK